MSMRFTDTSESHTVIQEENEQQYNAEMPGPPAWPHQDLQITTGCNQFSTFTAFENRFRTGQSNQLSTVTASDGICPTFLEPVEPEPNRIFFNEVAHSHHDCEEIPDSFIDVSMVLTLPEAESNPVWSYLDLLINVTQNYVKDPSDMLPPPKNSAQTSQQLVPHGASGGRHLKEITMRINIKNTLQTRNRLYQFQLVCIVAEDDNVRSRVDIPWTRIEVCTIVNNRATDQVLRPITKDIIREDIMTRSGDNSLGSFAFDGRFLYHVGPTTEHREGYSGELSARVASPLLNRGDQVITVEKSDRVVEPRKARAGRPSHRLTGELLMTRHQAEKIIEIRERWRGLTARQRRTHVKEADFYPLLTLNRDEAAGVLSVCTTWFKDIIRLQGIIVWPGRPLRRSGAELEELKENLASANAAIQFVQPQTQSYFRQQNKIRDLEDEIKKNLHERLKVVQGLVSEKYFDRYIKENGHQHLNPEWDTLPPPVPKGM